MRIAWASVYNWRIRVNQVVRRACVTFSRVILGGVCNRRIRIDQVFIIDATLRLTSAVINAHGRASRHRKQDRRDRAER
jgi:hypothetical protein